MSTLAQIRVLAMAVIRRGEEMLVEEGYERKPARWVNIADFGPGSPLYPENL